MGRPHGIAAPPGPVRVTKRVVAEVPSMHGPWYPPSRHLRVEFSNGAVVNGEFGSYWPGGDAAAYALFAAAYEEARGFRDRHR